MSYYQTTPRHRSYSLTQPVQMAPSYPYQVTPYSGYSALAPTYYDSPGNSSRPFFVAPSISGRSRSRSRSRPRHGHSHGHNHSHGHSHSHGHGRPRRRSQSHHRQHGQQRRSHSTTSHRQQRPHHTSHQPQTRITYPRQTHHSPTIGERIRSLFGFKNDRYVDQYGRPADNRGRSLQKY